MNDEVWRKSKEAVFDRIEQKSLTCLELFMYIMITHSLHNLHVDTTGRRKKG